MLLADQGGNTIPALDASVSGGVVVSSKGATVYDKSGQQGPTIPLATYQEDVGNYTPPTAVSATNSTSGAVVNASIKPATVGTPTGNFSPIFLIAAAAIGIYAIHRWG